MRESRVCDSGRARCPACDSTLHGVRVDHGSMWVRCPKCSQSIYVLGAPGGVSITWAVTGPEFFRLSRAGMLARDVLGALEVIVGGRAE